MTNQEIVNEVMNYLNNQYAYIRELDAVAGNGGKIREASKEITETLTELIWNRLAERYPTLKAEIVVGETRPYRIIDEQGYYMDESVDRHGYINGELVVAIECKTYLDKPFMQRANDDLGLMKSSNQPFDGIIISIENSIADNSYYFLLNRKNINKVYYLATGKRQSAKYKKICYHTDRIQESLIMDLVNDMENKYFKKFLN